MENTVQNEIVTRFAAAIKWLKDKKGAKNLQLMEALGISKNTLAKYLTADVSDIQGRAIGGLYSTYGVNPMWVLCGEGRMLTEKAEYLGGYGQDIEAERAKLLLAAKRAELQLLSKISLDDDPAISMQQLDFANKMAERLQNFQKSLFDKETTH